MTLSAHYFSYAGTHDAKDYPGVTEAQSRLVLPMDIYDQDIEFLSYPEKYVCLYPSLLLCPLVNLYTSFYTFDSDLSSNNSSAPSPLTSPMENSDPMSLIMPSSYPAWDDPNDLMNNAISESQASTASIKGDTKAQCWDHGCNGRVFSTWSNLKRHQKEKSGQAKKVLCPQCGGEFTRVTARDTHLAKGSCNRIRRYSNGRQRPSRIALLEMLMQHPSARESAV